jgi:formate/nitrite transporter FocA (FNT family)
VHKPFDVILLVNVLLAGIFVTFAFAFFQWWRGDTQSMTGTVTRALFLGIVFTLALLVITTWFWLFTTPLSVARPRF